MTKIIRITESQINSLVNETLKKVLKEANEDENEPDMNNEETPNYAVYLWPGAGYRLDKFEVNADSEEEALDKVTAELVNSNQTKYFAEVEDVSDNPENFYADNQDMEDDPEGYIYVDATEYGANRPVYVNIENAVIKKL